MALETLKDVKEINGFEVTRGVSNFSKDRPIFIHDDTNQIAFQIQNGPIKEAGVNGCQVDEVITTAKMMIEGLNAKFPCRENAVAITKLDEALMWLDKRKKDRLKRNVEGTSAS
jgi:hypothetical protein